MQKFYHFTSKQNVAGILLKGLKTGAEAGINNAYLGRKGNPDFIYLWNSKSIRSVGIFAALGINPGITVKNTALFKIYIHEQCVERDYDQLLHLFEEAKKQGDESFALLRRAADGLGAIIRGEISEENIKIGIDNIPKEIWEKRPGSYRTKQTDLFAVLIPWSKVVPIWARIIGIFSRPVFKIL